MFPILFMTRPNIGYAIYDLTINQTPVSDLRYNKFPSLEQCYISVNIICEGLLLITLFMTKMAKIG